MQRRKNCKDKYERLIKDHILLLLKDVMSEILLKYSKNKKRRSIGRLFLSAFAIFIDQYELV